MDLSKIPPSKNFADRTNTLTPPVKAYDPNYDDFWRRMRVTPNDDSSIPQQTNPGWTPPVIPYHELTDEEKTYVKDYGFTDKDILLMRVFKASPGQVMSGWNYQPGRN
jgi:hypothetical protein